MLKSGTSTSIQNNSLFFRRHSDNLSLTELLNPVPTVPTLISIHTKCVHTNDIIRRQYILPKTGAPAEAVSLVG